MITNRWPTEAEVEAHPDGRDGWWVLTFITMADWEPRTFDGEGVLECARLGEWPTPDTAFPLHRGAPVALTLPEVAGRLAAELPVDEAHSARVRDLLQEAGQARGGGQVRILPETLSAVIAAAESCADPMAGSVELQAMQRAFGPWVAEGRPV